jgi:hypothetical protein
MAGLSINPLAKLVASTSEAVSKTTGDVQSSLPQVGDAFSKANLDSKVSQLGGGLNSGLNQFASLGKSALTEAQSAMGSVDFKPSSLPSLGNITNLQSLVGSTSNITADISGTLNKLTGGNLAGSLQGIAGSISSAAGMLNNILSLKRGANLPSGGELFMKQGSAITLSPGSSNDWRVRITCQWNLFGGAMFQKLAKTGGVVWPYTPNITISTKANYTPIEPVHSNYPFYGYKNSSVEDIQISGEFTCETEDDAAYWIAATTFFKTATKMFFGEGALAGNPPLICNLTGYGSSVFDKVPVIIKSFSVDLKDDVNYIQCGAYDKANPTWVPVVSTISVTVAPVYNRRRLRKFNLENYARGETAQGGDGIGYL